VDVLLQESNGLSVCAANLFSKFSLTNKTKEELVGVDILTSPKLTNTVVVMAAF